MHARHAMQCPELETSGIAAGHGAWSPFAGTLVRAWPVQMVPFWKAPAFRLAGLHCFIGRQYSQMLHNAGARYHSRMMDQAALLLIICIEYLSQ